MAPTDKKRVRRLICAGKGQGVEVNGRALRIHCVSALTAPARATSFVLAKNSCDANAEADDDFRPQWLEHLKPGFRSQYLQYAAHALVLAAFKRSVEHGVYLPQPALPKLGRGGARGCADDGEQRTGHLHALQEGERRGGAAKMLIAGGKMRHDAR